MCRLASVVMVFVIAAGSVLAESQGPWIGWKGWKVGSNERLCRVTPNPYHTLRALVDGDPNTAWVYHKLTPKQIAEGKRASTPELWISVPKGVEADELWLRNGFDKSDELFQRNNRVVEVKVGAYDERRRVRLSDRRGRHKISLPDGLEYGLMIEMTRQIKGRDDDVCISEIALYNHGHKVDFHVPQYVLFNDGGECCCGNPDYTFVSPSGSFGETLHGAEFMELEWDTSGRFVTALAAEAKRGTPRLAVGNHATGHVWYKELAKPPQGVRYEHPMWVDNHRVKYFLKPAVAGHTVTRSFRIVTVR